MTEARAIAPAAASASNRLPGLDVAKGLAAIGVVTIHAAPNAPDWYLEHVIGGLARLAVPLFLVVSGLLVGWRGAAPARFRGDFARFLRLHVVWSLFYWGVAETYGLVDAPRTLKWIALRFGEGAYPGQYYFLILVQIYGLLALASWLPVGRGEARTASHVVRFWEGRTFLATSAVAAAIGLSLLGWVMLGSGREVLPHLVWRVLGSANAVWLWIVFFALGARLGNRARSGWSGPSPRATRALLVAGVVIATLAWPRIPPFDANRLSYASVVLYLASACIAVALVRASNRTGPGWLTQVGQRSFGVFVLNPLLLFSVEAVLGDAHGVLDSLVRVAVVVAVACPLARWLERVAPWSMR